MIYQDNLTVEQACAMTTHVLPPEVYATAAGTLTLTVASATQIVFTGTTAGQIVKLPNVTTPTLLGKGWTYYIWNTSNKVITVQYSDGTLFTYIIPGAIMSVSLYNNTTTTGLWVREISTTNPAAGAVAFSNSFNTSTTDFVEHNSTAWLVICSFVFRGTAVFTPTEYQIVGSRPTSGGIAQTRIVDFTNAGNIVGTLDFTAAAKSVYTTATLSNLPVDEAVWELQVRKDLAGSDKLRIHAFNLR